VIAPLALIMLISGMANSGSEGAWARVKAKIVGAFVQECPPEIAACEVCRRLRCESPEWIACERRLKAEHYLRAGDHASVEGLRAGHRCECETPDSDRSSRSGSAS
jgi:hypothetical protein